MYFYLVCIFLGTRSQLTLVVLLSLVSPNGGDRTLGRSRLSALVCCELWSNVFRDVMARGHIFTPRKKNRLESEITADMDTLVQLK